MTSRIQVELYGLMNLLHGDLTVSKTRAALKTCKKLEKVVNNLAEYRAIDDVRKKFETALEKNQLRQMGSNVGAQSQVPSLKRKLHGNIRLYTTSQFALDDRNLQPMVHMQEVSSRDMQIEHSKAHPDNQIVLRKQIKALQNELSIRTEQVNDVTRLYGDAAVERDRAKEMVERHEEQNEDYYQTIKDLRKKLSEVHQPITQNPVPSQDSELISKIQVLEAALSLKDQQIIQMQQDHQDVIRQQSEHVAHTQQMVQTTLKLESRLDTLQNTLTLKGQQIFQIQQYYQESIRQMTVQLNYIPNLQAQLHSLQMTVSQKELELSKIRNSKSDLATVLQMYLAKDVPETAPQLEVHELEVLSAQIKQESHGPGEVEAPMLTRFSVGDSMMIDQRGREMLELRSDTSRRDLSEQTGNVESLSPWTMYRKA